MFSPAEEAIIVFARTSTWFQPITDEIWAAALRRHFTEKQCVEISFTVGLNQLVSRFHAAVQTDVDASTTESLAGSCPVPLPVPPGAAGATA